MPVIARITIKRGKKKYIGIGDEEVEVSKDFRLYLHTKLSNPHYPPEIQAETTLVNFSVTQQGLEEQLLSLVVKFERPDLAAQRSALILQQNLFTIKVKQLEDNILRRLADAQGDITEDRALIEELELSKKISDEIVIKLDESRITSEKIITTSEQYRPVARRGALIFFVMNNLHKMHTYYMFSLNSFVIFFLRGIKSALYPGTETNPNPAVADQGQGEDVLRGSDTQEMDLDTLGLQINRLNSNGWEDLGDGSQALAGFKVKSSWTPEEEENAKRNHLRKFTSTPYTYTARIKIKYEVPQLA